MPVTESPFQTEQVKPVTTETPSAPENPTPESTPSVDVEADYQPESPKPSDNTKGRQDVRDAVPSSFLDRLINNGKAPKKEADKSKDDKSEVAKDGESSKPEQDKAPEKAISKPKKAKKMPESKPITEEDIVRVASEAATRAASEVSQRAPVQEVPRGTTPVTPAEPEISEALTKELPIYRKLAEMDPAKYGKVVGQLAEFSAREKQYKANWEAQNPGDTFDPEDEQHNKFFESNFPNVDSEDFDSAKEQVIEERAVAKAEERISKKMEEKYGPDIVRLQQERATQEIRPAIEIALKSAAIDILGAMDPNYAPLGETLEKMQTLRDVDPMAADVAEEVFIEKVPMLVEVKKMHVKDAKGNWVFVDPKRPTPLQDKISDLAYAAERLIPTLPMEKQVQDGRKFATYAEYAAMTPQQQARHWFLDEQQLTNLVIVESSRLARERYEKKKADYSRYTGKPYTPKKNGVETSQENGVAQQKQTAKPTTTPTQKPESPSVGGRPVVANGTSGEGNGMSEPGSLFFNRLGLK